jgi:hypothetical protein
MSWIPNTCFPRKIAGVFFTDFITPPILLRNINFKFFRHEDSGESVREMDSMKEMGEQFYAESGNLCKLVGVLRATDIFWNPAKR